MRLKKAFISPFRTFILDISVEEIWPLWNMFYFQTKIFISENLLQTGIDTHTHKKNTQGDSLGRSNSHRCSSEQSQKRVSQSGVLGPSLALERVNFTLI